MYTWKQIHSACVFLLLLPLTHFATLVGIEATTTLNSKPTAWQGEVDSYVRADENNPLPEQPVVVIGGRRASLWPELAATVAPLPLVARPLGNAIVNDFIYYYERLVSYYQPRAVVLLPEETEFHLRDNKNAKQLAEAIERLVTLDTSHSGQRLFYVFNPIKTPLHPHESTMIDEVGQRLGARGKDLPTLKVIDPNPLLATPDGKPDPSFFRSDGLHLNESGYLRLGALLRQALKRDFPVDFGIHHKT
ncbi:MAG: hypothetical protein ACK5HY_06635 [Parahaliea sp.]